MQRTQISLSEELLRRARSRSMELGISLAEYIRRLVSRDLDRQQPRADVSEVFDLGRTGDSDIARRKDEMIGQSMAAEPRSPYGEE